MKQEEVYWTAGIITILGIACIFRLRRSAKIKSWPKAKGAVVGPRTMGDSSRVDVRFTLPNGQEILGITGSEFAHSTLTVASERIPFQVGSVVEIAYDPENPNDIEILSKRK